MMWNEMGLMGTGIGRVNRSEPVIGLTTGSLVEPAGEDRGEGGSSRSGVPSRGDARTRRRA